MRKSAFILAAIAVASSAFALTATKVETNVVDGVEFETLWTYDINIGSNPRTATLLRLEDAAGEVTLKNLISVNGTLYTVTNIADGAIADNPALLKCTVPNTILRIGAYAFSGCTSLAEVELGYGVRHIGERAFSNTIVREIKVPDSLLEMGGNISAGTLFTSTINIDDSSHFVYSDDGVLYNRDMTKLYACPTRAEGTVKVPNTVTNICQDAFFGCHRLTYLNIPDSITTIGKGAFNVAGIWPGLPAPESTPKLESIFYNGPIPNAADDIYSGAPADLVSYALNNAWSGMSTWKGRPAVIIDEANPPILPYTDSNNLVWYYQIVDGHAEIYNNGEAAIEPKTTSGVPYYSDEDLQKLYPVWALQIPRSINGYVVTKIGDHAFDGCNNLSRIGIPPSVEAIGDYAFNGCSAVKFIGDGDGAFGYDTSIKIPSGVTSLGYHPFEGIKLQSVTMPFTVTEIADNPLAGMDFAATIDVDAGNPNFHSESNILYDKRKGTVIAVPANYDGSTALFLGSVTTIGDEALLGCKNITQIQTPESLENIGAFAFAGCASLKSLVLPDTLTQIGDAAFLNCISLEKVTYDGNAPTAADDIYENTPATMTSYAVKGATGFTEGTWKGRPIVINDDDAGDTSVPDVINQVYDDGSVKWTYDVVGGKAVITKAEGYADAETVTIPGALGGFTTSDLKSTALDALSGVRAYESNSGRFVARNGCLYSADGMTLIRVPSGLTLPYSVTTAISSNLVTVTTIPGILDSDNPGNDGTSVRTSRQTVASSSTTTQVDGDISFATILSGVTGIADHAFYGCNAALVNERSDSSAVVSGETGFIGANGDPYVKTVTSELIVTKTYKTVIKLPASVTSVAEKAFEGSAVETGGAVVSSSVGVTPSDQSDAPSSLDENENYIGWIVNVDGRVTGTVTAKTGKRRNGILKVTGSAVRIGSKKTAIKSESQLYALGDVRLVKDISKSTAGKSAFKAFKGKCWTMAYETSVATAGVAGYAALSVSVSQNGKVRVKGNAPDGTKITGTAQMVKDGEQFRIPIAVQTHAGKKGGIALCLDIGTDGSIHADSSAESKVVVSGNVVTLPLALVDAHVLGGNPGSYLLVGDEAAQSGFELDSTLKGWKPRYTKSSGEIKGTVNFYGESDGRRVRATVSGVVVDGVGYCSVTVKKVGSWPALIVPLAK